MVIPEGDWYVFTFLCFQQKVFLLNRHLLSSRFCPACNHKSLLSELGSKLDELDVLLKKTEAERRRKERLAFVNKSLSK